MKLGYQPYWILLKKLATLYVGSATLMLVGQWTLETLRDNPIGWVIFLLVLLVMAGRLANQEMDYDNTPKSTPEV
jgi:hypothetical protein